MNSTIETSTKPKKKKGCLKPFLIILPFFMVATIIIGVQNEKKNAGNNESKETEISIICDVEQYAGLTASEIIKLFGEPNDKGNSKCLGSFDTPCIYYDYTNTEPLGDITFEIVNDKVVRLIAKNTFCYSSVDALFNSFGMEKQSSSPCVADTGYALRYRCPSEKVDDFWIQDIDEDTFGWLSVTYDMQYYEEWYLPMATSERTDYQIATEKIVKTILKSPKSAVFPSISNYNICKNDFYVAVQSYVDAQNSFGATVRSKFTFYYSVGTKNIVYAIFDGEEIINNEYTPTAKLIEDSLKK